MWGEGYVFELVYISLSSFHIFSPGKKTVSIVYGIYFFSGNRLALFMVYLLTY